MIHPIWVIWLMISMIPMMLGGAWIANETGLIYLPQVLIFIQLVFILYCFIPREYLKKVKEFAKSQKSEEVKTK